ncbi:MAG TPA: GrpB family protein [Pseudomonadales bacterium]|nr:GrpB family protein [Pseudomonadales bacterium]
MKSETGPSSTPRVEIFDHRPSWRDDFARIAAVQRAALGPLALRIDHIGSTSVPGLCAKDVIDVQISVAALDQSIVAALERIGYQRAQTISTDHRPPDSTGPDTDWDKLYFRPPPGQRRTNTHVRVLDRPNQRYALLFREYLIAHPKEAAAYGELKRRLAASLADPEDYPDVKDPACDLIYLPAQRWAVATQWRPRPSDA